MNSEAIKFGKSRSDCDSGCIDLLLRFVTDRANLEGCIVELGAYKCGATIAMAGVTNKTIYSHDTFGGLPYENQGGFENFGNTDYEEIAAVTSAFLNIRLIRGKHEVTVPEFPAQPVSLIFMDSDFYSSHQIGLATLWPMLVPGGAVVFHDWTFHGVQQAIAEEIPATETSFLGRLQDSNMGAAVKK